MDDRQRLVMELKEQIRQDAYRVDPDAVAAAIVARLLGRVTVPGRVSEHVLEARELGLQAVQSQA